MKRTGILNAELNLRLAGLGHTDTVVVADCGLPRPPGVPVVDLAVVFGVPSFEQVLTALAAEIVVEAAVLAEETTDRNPGVVELVGSLFGRPGTVPHERLKELSRDARLIIRTGEATAYANVILRCGVPF
ncbi:MAG: D-ribose pyranase [Propionibacteriaceae bacterium]|nr:D-ribose pyranase [Propionibacteriaceae bacterium]